MAEIDTATLEARLTEVDTVLHQLALGASVGRITLSDGKVVEYRQTSLGALRAYRESLRRQLGLEADGARTRRVVVG